ncbi:hypothetical protein BX281_5334 [Streptomyces sp. Ag82_O1-15]|nr:hypothetical protein BX281_5334 [Streptomyces sp. Ag82_O1-15]
MMATAMLRDTGCGECQWGATRVQGTPWRVRSLAESVGFVLVVT